MKSKSTETDNFIQTSLDMLAIPGFSPRLRELYGRMRFHAGKHGECFATHATLAKEIGLTDRKHVLRLLHRLEALRLVKKIRRGRYSNTYRVLNPDVAFLRHVMSLPCDISDVASKRHRKEGSSSKEASKRGSGPATAVVTEKAEPRPKRTAPKSEAENDVRTERTKPKNVDDDEPKKTLSPEQEFRERLSGRNHGPQFDVESCLANVKRQLDKGALSLADFVAYDLTRTTGAKFTNPSGFYVSLAKDLVKATREQVVNGVHASIRRAAEANPPEPPKKSDGRCAKCGGSGRVREGEYCECALGRDLATVERRKPKSETTKEKTS